MKLARSLTFVYSLAALAFAAGILLTTLSFAGMSAQAKKLNEKNKALAALNDLQEEGRLWQAALLTLESSASKRPAPIGELVGSHLSGANPEIRPCESVDLPNGWTLERVELVCADLDLNRLASFLQAAEAGRPPWRLRELSIAASREGGGFGRAAMALESLSKSER